MHQIPKRKEIRLKNYDYSKQGIYFITICTKNREQILSEIHGSVKTDPYIKLTNYGKIIENELLNIYKHFSNINISDYIIMPDHIHFIIEIKNVGAVLDQPVKLHNIIGLFKSGVSKKINVITKLNDSIWQRNYYEHIIRNEKEYLKIKQYILENPIRWVYNHTNKSMSNNVGVGLDRPEKTKYT